MNTSTKQYTDEQIEQAEALLLPKVSAVVNEVKAKYRLSNRKFFKQDFFRICAGENIQLANTENFRFMADSGPELLGCLMTIPGDPVVKAVYLRTFFAAGEFDTTTAAHELGHHFLHAHKTGKTSEVLLRTASRSDQIDSDICELEANLFAKLMLKV